MMDYEHAGKMKALLDHLFKTACPPGGENAFEGAVNFRSGQQMQGTITSVRVGDFEVLKIATPAMKPHPEHGTNPRFAQKVMLEHYFGHEDIECVVAMREVDASKIVGDVKPSIILGG